MTASVDIRGGAPGTRETETISGHGLIEQVHGVVLSGGSAFGLSAASAVQQFLAAKRKGFEIGGLHIPIVPQLILFDLLNHGQTEAPDPQVYIQLAKMACQTASADISPCGSVGAGYGATTANLRGGLGTAFHKFEDGLQVASLVAVNALGSVTVADTPHFWAAPFERHDEFGGHGCAPTSHADALSHPPLKGVPSKNPTIATTTIGVVITNADLDQRSCRRLAVMAQTGLARAIHPVHTPLDGDGIFALASRDHSLTDQMYDLARLGSAAADCLSRAVARAIYKADPAPPGWTGPPSYQERFGNSTR